MSYQMQALSSSDGILYTWIATTPDFAGAGYAGAGGTGSPLDIAISSAPSASGSSGSPGVGLVAACDAVATSNISLTGTAAEDGVTMTAGVSRVACVAQSSTSQNGPWLVQSGAWARPADFTSDAQVAASLGAPLYIKPGGLTGGDTTWYLKTGTTIAGAKTYAQQKTKTLASVRAIQTRKLLTIYGDPWVYDGTAQTWTEPYVVGIVGGVGGSAWPVFDFITPVNGDRVEVGIGTGTVDGAVVSNGVYVVTTVGSVSTKAVLTRAPDLNSTVAFASPIAYEVYDGSVFKGVRRQLLTQAPITLGTTALQFATVAPASGIVDLSKAPYNIRDYSASNYDKLDYGRALDAFCYAYRGAGHVRGILPYGNGGLINVIEPFSHYGGVTIEGGGDYVSLLNFGAAGGHMCTAQVLASNLTDDGMPSVGGTLVDTYANATPLSTWRNGHGDTLCKFFYNLSHCGLIFNDWTQFECRILIRIEQIGGVGGNDPLGHIVSCRGKRTVADNDYGPTAFEGCPFSITLFEQSSPFVMTARMRLTDTTAGVYGSVTHTGSGSGTVTGDGTVKPTEDAPNFTVRIENGGTAGVAGVKVSWAVDGQRFCAPQTMGTATALVIANEVNAFDQPFSAKVNFSGALVAGDTYKIPCSGVNQQINLTSSTNCAINTNYDVLLQYRGGHVYFYVSPSGGALDSGASTTGTAATGVVRQRYWENTILGRAVNSGVFEASSDFEGTRLWLGGIRFMSSNVVAPSATVTTLYDNLNAVTGSKFCWVPNSVDVRLDAVGALRQRYVASAEPGLGVTYVLPRSSNTGAQFGDGGFEKLTFSMGGGLGQHASGLLMVGWRTRNISDVGFVGGHRGASCIGPDFGSIWHNIRWQSLLSHSLEFFQGTLLLSGQQNCNNGGGACYFVITSASVVQTGVLFQNTDTNRKAMLLSELGTSRFFNISIDAENQQQSPTGRELIRVCMLDNCSVDFSGNMFLVETLGVITQTGDASAGQGGRVLIDNMSVTTIGATISGVGVNNWPPFSSQNVNLPPFQVGDGVTYSTKYPAFPVPMTDLANKWQVNNVAGVQALTSGTQAVAFQRGVVLKLSANTLGANSAYTIGTLYGLEGDFQEILIEPQATYTTTIVNGGPAGGNVQAATPAATKDRLRLRLAMSGGALNWVST